MWKLKYIEIISKIAKLWPVTSHNQAVGQRKKTGVFSVYGADKTKNLG